MPKKKIVVIGGGLAGSLICNALAEHADVTLLEAGGRNSIRYPRITFEKKKLAEVNTFCYGGGGTTNLWHNGLIPINRDDVGGRDFSEVLADAESYRDQAASALFFRSGPYSTVYEKTVAEMTGIAGKLGVFPDGIDCLIYPRRYARLTVDPKVRACYNVDTTGFVFDGRRIRTVNYTVGSTAYSLDADVVVLAAGAMGSPKLLRNLLLSSGHPLDGLGTGFIDHPTGFVGKVRFKKEAAGLIGKLSLLDKGDYVCRSAVRLRSGEYTCCVFFRPAVTMENRLSLYKYKSRLGASAGTARFRNALSWKLFHPDIVAEISSHVFGFNIPTRTYNILFIAEQKRGNNRVYYDGDDLRVDWSISERELEIYRSLLEKLKGMLLNAAEQVKMETNITEDWLWSCAHHSCTTPLGSAAEDLIDKDLKLRIIDNVFVCDGSVIQEHSYANTGLTIGELALRLSKRVLNAAAA